MKTTLTSSCSQSGRARVIVLIAAAVALVVAGTFVLRTKRMNSPENTLQTLRAVTATALAHAKELPQGAIDLTAPAFSDLRLSTGFAPGPTLRTPWGNKLTLTRAENVLIVDLYEIPQTMCVSLMNSAASLPGIKRAAVNTMAADERTLPLDAQQVEKDCSKRAEVLRYMVDLTPAATTAAAQ